jgi:hypothetical protein
VAFEAHAYFHSRDGETLVYDYGLVGPGPRSGGDTYNASTAVDDEIYFGGWVHAPAPRPRRGEVDFRNKYSHLHVFDKREWRVGLLWREGIGSPRLWAGEVTGLLYNPARDTLLLARGDGHKRLGVYEANRRGGRVAQVSPARVLRGAIYMDHACFSLHHGWGGAPGVHCLDLEGYRGFTQEAPAGSSSDGGPLPLYRSGDVAAAYTRLYIAARGGVYVFDPFGGEPPVFHRLLDFSPGVYSPLRSNMLPLAGGLLAAFSAVPHSTVRGTPELPPGQQAASRLPPGPSVLLHLAPPTARIVAALGARVTSLAYAGGWVLAATVTGPNLERYDATLVDHCAKDILALGVDSVVSPRQPAVSFLFRVARGRAVLGGLPLLGYRRALLRLLEGGGGGAVLHYYTLHTPPGGADSERLGLRVGEAADLSTPTGRLVSFTLPPGLYEAVLEP